MKKILTILGVIAAVFAIVFSVLPISNLAFIPAIFAFAFGFIALYYSKKQGQSKKTIQYIFLLTVIALAITIYRSVYTTSEVNDDIELQEKEKEFEENAIEELEELNIEDLNIEE